jgi:hypothetical protein
MSSGLIYKNIQIFTVLILYQQCAISFGGMLPETYMNKKVYKPVQEWSNQDVLEGKVAKELVDAILAQKNSDVLASETARLLLNEIHTGGLYTGYAFSILVDHGFVDNVEILPHGHRMGGLNKLRLAGHKVPWEKFNEQFAVTNFAKVRERVIERYIIEVGIGNYQFPELRTTLRRLFSHAICSAGVDIHGPSPQFFKQLITLIVQKYPKKSNNLFKDLLLEYHSYLLPPSDEAFIYKRKFNPEDMHFLLEPLLNAYFETSEAPLLEQVNFLANCEAKIRLTHYERYQEELKAMDGDPEVYANKVYETEQTLLAAEHIHNRILAELTAPSVKQNR